MLGAPLHAETLTVTCEDAGEKAPAALTLGYEGGASGTLTVKAPFGEMSLPATKEQREDVEGGKNLAAREFAPSGLRPSSCLTKPRSKLVSRRS